jgi:hypothetical protein
MVNAEGGKSSNALETALSKGYNFLARVLLEYEARSP